MKSEVFIVFPHQIPCYKEHKGYSASYYCSTYNVRWVMNPTIHPCIRYSASIKKQGGQSLAIEKAKDNRSTKYICCMRRGKRFTSATVNEKAHMFYSMAWAQSSHGFFYKLAIALVHNNESEDSYTNAYSALAATFP